MISWWWIPLAFVAGALAFHLWLAWMYGDV